MRVLLVTDALPTPPRGGLDLHVRELAEQLGRRGHTTAVWAFADAAPDALAEPSRLPGSNLRRSLQGDGVEEAFADELRRFDPDAVHIHNLQGLSPRLPALARSFGAQVVWTHHDLFAVCPRVHFHRGDGSACDGSRRGVACGPCHSGGVKGVVASPVFAVRHGALQDAIRRTHVSIAPSAWVRDALIAEGADADRVHVVPTAVPAPSRLAMLPGREGPARFVFAGDLRHAKGADLAVAAIAGLEPGRAHLEVHGGAPAPPAPPEADFEAGLRATAGADVSFHGRYAPDDLAGILDGATALLLPSRVRETFGRTANLAWQLGVPVIAADHGGPAERVDEGRSGTLFIPGDVRSLTAAMGRVLRDGILMQAEVDRWPREPSLESAVDALLPHYVWRP